MQILPLADACALVAMSPEHRAAFVGAEAWKVGWGGTIEDVRNAVHVRNNPTQG